MPFELVEHITAEGDRFMVPVGWVPDEHTARCRSCNAPICWMVTPNGKKNPWSQASMSHFGDCPSSKRWQNRG